MTIAVLIFQLGIFVTMFAASLMGRGWLRVATGCWVLFTLFGSIYTMGLMALQLITVYFSYKFCMRRWVGRHPAPVSPPEHTPFEEQTYVDGKWVRKNER